MGEKVIHYTVDGDPQETTEHQLKVRQILEKAGLKPAADYYLVEYEGKAEKRFEDLDKEIHMHDGQVFVGVRRGPVPVS
jgi:hypothetical protein